MALPPKLFRLVGPDGREFWSEVPGKLGGHSRNKLYGRPDCRSALLVARAGHIVRHCFFANERTAVAAGYRPCAVCLPTSTAWGRSGVAVSARRRGDADGDASAPPGSGVE
jgi:hypothetical protein